MVGKMREVNAFPFLSWTEILKQGLAGGLVRDRHARKVENGNRV